MSWWSSYRAVFRTELKVSAIELADHGWPVLPGTYRQAGRWTGGPDADQSGPVPALADGAAGATLDLDAIESWWSARPYSVLLATGVTVDVIEVSALVGRRVCGQLREAEQVIPVAATPTGRWWFAVRAGEALRPELASRPDVVLHSRGSWVAAPPSEGPQGVVHWRVPPAACGWRLPDPYHLQVALLDVLGQRPGLASAGSVPGSVGTGVRC
ncbi:bifunctional DNA primase/polymerase [Pseudonocardia acaciae]|uniref:bifunctional DNA primase/polymerase n=1 Tax=Pseudonocardia acaciae TaxID=551276 RepID=UPI0006851E4C|nr:bifunctional DNA primase/polymerase [Pseudonocardia acaciae]